MFTSRGYRRTRALPPWLQMHNGVVLLLLMATTPRTNAIFDYTTIYCEKGIHTMVLFPQNCPGPYCIDFTYAVLSQSEKDAILHKHNELRNRIALGQLTPYPTAGDMKEMVWDKELETIAQRAADQCRYADYDCNHVQRFPVGQLIVEFKQEPEQGNREDLGSPDILMNYCLEKIRKRNIAIPPKPILSTEDCHTCTQIIWGETNHVGCARSSYVVDDVTRELLVCNYGTQGNLLGNTLYKIGTPCTECSCSSRYPALCEF